MKTDRPDPVFVGGRLTYTLTVRNAGPDTATNVRVADALPAGDELRLRARPPRARAPAARRALQPRHDRRTAPGAITIVVRPTEAGRAAQHGHGGRRAARGEHGEQPVDARRPSCAGRSQPPVASCPTHDRCSRGRCRSASADSSGSSWSTRTAGRQRRPDPGQGSRPQQGRDDRTAAAGSRSPCGPPRTGIVDIRMTNQPARCSTRRIGVVGVFLPPPVTG